MKKTSKAAAIAVGIVGAAGAGFGYTLYEMKKTPGELFEHLKEMVMSRFQEIADPDYTFMQNALGPPPPAPPDFDVPTIFLSVEGLLMHKEWDRKHGTRYVKRPNVEALLLGLTKQGFEVVFWCENSVGTMDEPLNRLLMRLPGQVMVGGVLGREHMYFRDNKGEKRIDSLPRPMSGMLVVDHDPKTFENQPDNTILVPKMEEFDENDTALLTILALATMYREERQKRRTSDLRSFLRSVAGGASAKDRDPAQLLEAFQTMAAERKARREEEMRTGLGGLLRNAQSSSATLSQGKAVTHTTGAAVPKIAEKSLMAAQRDKMRERMLRSQGGGGEPPAA